MYLNIEPGVCAGGWGWNQGRLHTVLSQSNQQEAVVTFQGGGLRGDLEDNIKGSALDKVSLRSHQTTGQRQVHSWLCKYRVRRELSWGGTFWSLQNIDS